MKFCFLINRAPFVTEFYSELVKEIEKRGDEYILVFEDKISEWKKRNLFPLNAKTFSEPDWALENKPNIASFENLDWKVFFGDFDRFSRYKVYNFNYENSRRIVSQTFSFAKYIFETEKPDVVMAEPATCVFNKAFGFFASKNNATYLGLMESRVPNHFDVYDKGYTCSRYKEDFNKELTEEEIKFAREFIESFVSHKKLPSYMDFQNKKVKMGQARRFLRYLKREREMFPYYLKYLSQRKKYKKVDFNSEILMRYIFKYFIKAIKSRIRKISQRNIFDAVKNERYYLFPLHLQPEASTAVRATYFCDQVNAIKNIAFALPFDSKLYVKEHPSAVGTQPDSFYKEIKKIPNVSLLHYKEDVKDLIANSEGVITLTSTIGLEAMFSGKPVYVFGDVFYEYHPLHFKVNGYEDLRQKLKEERVFSNDANERFFMAYYRNIVPGGIINLSSNDYSKIYNRIKERILR